MYAYVALWVIWTAREVGSLEVGMSDMLAQVDVMSFEGVCVISWSNYDVACVADACYVHLISVILLNE